MSHHIHHTEGFILDSRGTSEANKYFTIYTNNFGLIRASAQSVRKLESKLRFHLQDFNYIKLDLVQGREIWRITSAEKLIELKNFRFNIEINNLVKNISKLLIRLCPGEEKNEELFKHLIQIYQVLDQETFGIDEILNFECISVLRILHSLGYIDSQNNLEALIRSPINHSVIKEAGLVRKDLIKQINTSLKESHL